MYAIMNRFNRADTSAGKSILAVIKDSVFRYEKEKEQDKHSSKVGPFTFARVMG